MVRDVNHSQVTCQKSCLLAHSRGASGEHCTNLQRLELCHISGWNSHGFAPVHQDTKKDVNRGLVTTRDQPLLFPSGTACSLPLRRMLSTVLSLGITHIGWSLSSLFNQTHIVSVENEGWVFGGLFNYSLTCFWVFLKCVTVNDLIFKVFSTSSG